MRLITCILAMTFYSVQAMAEVKVVDGDSLEIDGKRIRLQGIDSPEYKQVCRRGKTAKYDCGDASRDYLQYLVDKGEVTCIEEDIDRYGRSLSTCYVDDDIFDLKYNINSEMIRSGWAVVYRSSKQEYLDDEQYAKDNKLGLWQGKFMRPELYRALNR